MASLISKRQQARNEKALQDLMHSVPGNKTCADCGSRNPGWASWSLGIFLCMRCASIHRKLGTHISKVKSLSMDGWTNDQVDKPPVPIDVDEADSAMERFIRSKYATVPSSNSAGRPSRSRSVVSDEGTPPPLPPKTGGKFFKTGSIFRSKKSSESQQTPRSPPSSDHLRNKPSKVFGASVQHDTVDDTAQKLSQLREMGFADDKRNAMVLKGVNGNLEKTVEAGFPAADIALLGATAKDTDILEHVEAKPSSQPCVKQPVGYASGPASVIADYVSDLGTDPEASQQNFYASPQALYGNNPFLAMNQNAQQMPFGQPQQQLQQQPLQQQQGFDQMLYQTQQPQQPQQQPQQQPMPQWHDKASIMALYNYPSLAPTPTQQPQEQVPQSATAAPGAGPQSAPQSQQQQSQRSASTPLPGNNNPFLNGQMGAAAPNPVSGSGSSPRSRDSMNLGMEMAWNNGRHSPDAFASLSSRTG
ncbi:UBA domain-containing protein 3 [Apiospora hydei]|uniref:UBA domain-containing protein 3 n=1 Tax=Apiospora hydei TaxID=1337664 RepID=A0ABR1X3A2_9PEZI